jgi:PAS domain S-box-containing protein
LTDPELTDSWPSTARVGDQLGSGRETLGPVTGGPYGVILLTGSVIVGCGLFAGDVSEVLMASEVEPVDGLSAVCRAVFDRYPNGAIALYDSELRFVYVGGAVLPLVGLTADGMLGSTVAELFAGPIAEAVTPIYRDALDGRAGSVEVTLEGRRLVVRTAPIHTSHEATLGLVTVEDVTSYW